MKSSGKMYNILIMQSKEQRLDQKKEQRDVESLMLKIPKVKKNSNK